MSKYANKVENSKEKFNHNFLEDVYSSMYGEDYSTDKFVNKSNKFLLINDWINKRLTKTKKSPKYKAKNEYEEFMRMSTLKKSEMVRNSSIEEDLTRLNSHNTSKKQTTLASLIGSLFNTSK